MEITNNIEVNNNTASTTITIEVDNDLLGDGAAMITASFQQLQ